AEPRLVEGGQPDPGAGDLGAVDGLVDQQEVSDEQGVLHAAGRDAERLDEEGPDEQEQAEGDENGLDPLPGPAAGRHRGACLRDCLLLLFRQPVLGGPVDPMLHGVSSEFTCGRPRAGSARPYDALTAVGSPWSPSNRAALSVGT